MQDKYKLIKLTKKSQFIEILWADKHISKFHFLWLRDNCPSAFHQDTKMRKFNILSVSEKIKPLNLNHTTTTLKINWSEGNHNSVFKLKWLRDFCYTEKNQHPYVPYYKLWDSKIIKKTKILKHDYKKIITNEKELKRWLQTMHLYGIAIIQNAPTQDKSGFKILDKIGKYRETFFGTPFEVINIPKPNNQAYTADALANHSDLPYYEYVPGYQFLHCLVNDAKGGSSTAVDSFAVANFLKKNHSKRYKLLTKNNVIFKDNDFTQKNVRVQKSPIIKVNKKKDFEEVRINLGAMGTLDLNPKIMDEFYNAYIFFYKQLNSKKFQISFKLKAGNIFCFDNRRILHGRKQFDPNSGNRHLQGYYIEREEITSKLNYLNKIKF